MIVFARAVPRKGCSSSLPGKVLQPLISDFQTELGTVLGHSHVHADGPGYDDFKFGGRERSMRDKSGTSGKEIKNIWGMDGNQDPILEIGN